VGIALWTVAAALGIAAVVQESATAFAVIKPRRPRPRKGPQGMLEAPEAFGTELRRLLRS
jgi:hypothetical protein